MYKQNVGNNVCKLRNSVQQYMIFYTALFYTASLSSFLLQKFELFYLRKKVLNFPRKCYKNARIMRNAFVSLKGSKKASMMYKSLLGLKCTVTKNRVR